MDDIFNIAAPLYALCLVGANSDCGVRNLLLVFLGAQDISKLFKKQSNKNTQTTNQSIPKKSFPSSHITSAFSVRLLFASAIIRLRDCAIRNGGFYRIFADKSG